MSKTEANIKKHLANGHSLTTLQALKLYGTLRLPEYVRRLRHEHGMKISMTRVTASDGKWFGVYQCA